MRLKEEVAMPTSMTLGTHRARVHPIQGLTFALIAILSLWLAFVLLLGARGNFVSAPGAPPLPIAIGVLLPVTVFLAALAMWRPFRELLLNADLALMTAIQAWRFAGLGFIALYTYGVLPGLFAWPAGLGDIAIGLTAPWVMQWLERRAKFAASKGLVVWNLLGILDLFGAVGTGTLSSLLAVGAAGEITTAPMAELPLVLIPAFLVPIFMMLHVSALIQERRPAGSGDRR